MLGSGYAMVNVCEGDCWSLGRELGWDMPFDLAGGLERTTGDVSIPE